MTDAKTSKIIYRGNGWALLKDTRSANLSVVASEHGKDRLFKSTGTSQLNEAKRIGAEIFRDYLKQAKREDVVRRRLDKPKILQDAWAKYLLLEQAKIVTGDLSEVTYKRKVNAWERMEYFWGGLECSELTQSNFILFAAEHERKHPNCSLQNEFKYLVALANFMHDNGIVIKRPQIELGKEKSKPREERRKLTTQELKRLLISSEYSETRSRVLISCGVYMGMRLSEVAKLKTDNVLSLKNKMFLALEDTKTDKNRTVQVPASCLFILKRAKDEAKGKWLFSNARDNTKHIPTQTLDGDWRRLFKVSGLDGLVFHELRHTAISAAVQKYELAKVSLYYGVSLKTLMKHYVHLDEFEIGEVSGAIEVDL